MEVHSRAPLLHWNRQRHALVLMNRTSLWAKPSQMSPNTRRFSSLLRVFVFVLLSLTHILPVTGSISVGPTNTSDNLIYLHVSPFGETESHFCGSEAHPCSLSVALHRAPPGSILVLEGGVYYGGHHITKSITLVGHESTAEGAVIFDGMHTSRIFWFDNVPARIEGITFRNGVGDGAGCVLVTRSGSQAGEANQIHRCNFYNCTASSALGDSVSFPSRRAAAGAVAIVYDRQPTQINVELSGCNFRDNFGRGNSKAVGALAIHYDNEHAPSAYGCSHIAVVQQTSDRKNADLSHGYGFDNGLVFSRLTTFLFNGKPVYKSLDKANRVREGASGGGPLYIAYCHDQNLWALSSAVPGQRASVTLHESAGGCLDPILNFRCSADTVECDSILMARRVFRGDVEFISVPSYFVCQDVGQECKTVLIEGASGLQAHRNGLYELTKSSFGGRPVFKQTPPLGAFKPQYLRYCVPTNEWMVGDDDPALLAEEASECLRGMASSHTLAIHPTLVFGWKYWDTDTWRVSPFPGGITVSCAPSLENRDFCPILSAVNFPTSVVGIEPTLQLNTSGLIFGRPSYVDLAHMIFLWYCPRYREWAMSSIPAPAGADEECVRSLSSSETLEADPRLAGDSWELFSPSGSWGPLQGRLRMKCSEDCPRIHVEVEWVPEDSGVYEAVGRLPLSQHRVYRQISPPYNMAFFSTDVLRWSIVGAEGGALYSAPTVTLTEQTPLQTTNWTRHNGEPISIHMACNSHTTCAVVNISSPSGSSRPNGAPDGAYALQRYLIGDRPVFAGLLSFPITHKGVVHTTGFIYYCAPKRRWVIGPKPVMGMCTHWVAAHPSASYYPHLWTVWRHGGVQLFATCGGSSEKKSDRAHRSSSPSRRASLHFGSQDSPITSSLVPINPLHRARREIPVSVPVSDVFTDCNFSHNRAVINGEALAAGAVSILFNRVRAGITPSAIVRRATLRGNEGLTTRAAAASRRTFSVGGVSVTSAAAYTVPTLFLSDSSITENRGSAGGVYTEHLRAHVTRLTLARNYATNVGGGFAGFETNYSFSHTICRQNTAVEGGGCGHTDVHSLVTMSRSEVINNSAMTVLGTCMKGGTMHIADSKVNGMHHQAIVARTLSLNSCELSCGKHLVPRAVSGGFGCIPDVSAESAITQEAVAIDTFVGPGRRVGDSDQMVAVQNTHASYWASVVAYWATLLHMLYTPYFVVPAVTFVFFPYVWDLFIAMGVIPQPRNQQAQAHRNQRRR